MSDETEPQREYRKALAAYRRAMVRLQAAKRDMPPTAQDRHKQRLREKREAARAHYLAHKDEIDAQEAYVTAKAMDLLQQHMTANLRSDINRELGDTLRIRLPPQDTE